MCLLQNNEMFVKCIFHFPHCASFFAIKVFAANLVEYVRLWIFLLNLRIVALHALLEINILCIVLESDFFH